MAIRLPRIGACVWVVAVACAVAVAIPAGFADEITTKGFAPRQTEAAIADLAAEFTAQRDRGSWEKAFATLAKFADSGSDRLMPAKDGVWLPCTRVVQNLLILLPQDGRQAYRLFYDAKARQLLDRVTTQNLNENQEASALRVLVRQYLITSIGARAADRLGDLYFSRGEFAEAEECWRLILTQCPDSDLSILRLQLKRATALARMGRWEELKSVRQAVIQRGGEGPVVIGGQRVEPTQYLATLPSCATPAASRPISSPEIALPEADSPLWQNQFISAKVRDQLNRQAMNYGQSSTVLTTEPPAAFDEQRVYVNWLGACMAVDVQTGKTVWQTRSPDTWSDPEINYLLYVDSRLFTISKQGNMLLATAPLHEMDNRNGMMPSVSARLARLNPQNGRVIWTTRDNVLSSWGFLGNQVVAGDVIYAAARDALKQEVTLLAIDAESGALRWSVPLGVPQSMQTMRGTNICPTPMLMQTDAEILLLTNDGVVMAVDPAAKAVAWALSYEPPERMLSDPWMNRIISSPPAASAQIEGDRLWVKDGEGACLWCLALTGPERVWRRPVTAVGSLAGMDEQCFYVAGDSLDAFDRQSRGLAWSTPMPACKGSMIFTRDHIFAFTTRGIYQVRKTDGTVVRILRGGDLGNSGDLRCIGDRLIAVSAFNVTAYPLAPPEAPPEVPPEVSPAGDRTGSVQK